jgi:phosphoesterase RecJ-like protein
MKPPKSILDFLKVEDNFIIATHMNPDGDGLGSAIALSLALRKIGKKTILVCKDKIPQQYKFLPRQEEFCLLREGIEKELDYRGFKNLVLIDCNDIDRLLDKKQDSNLFSFLSSLFSVVIDHHETEKGFGNIRWIISDSAATGLMIFHLIKNLYIDITEEMAINLYSALAVDTGNFRYENTSAEVLSVASELIKLGIKPHTIYRELFESWSKNRFDLFLKTINTLEIINDIAIIYVTKKMFEETDTSPDDIEHFVEFPRIMKDIKVSVLFREIAKDHYKVSLRSKDEINVAKVASLFGGGGHKNASGFKINKELMTLKKLLLDKLLIELSPNTL